MRTCLQLIILMYFQFSRCWYLGFIFDQIHYINFSIETEYIRYSVKWRETFTDIAYH